LRLEYDGPLPNFALKFNLRRYNKVSTVSNDGRLEACKAQWEEIKKLVPDVKQTVQPIQVRRCRLTLSNPCRKRHLMSCFQFLLSNSICATTSRR